MAFTAEEIGYLRSQPLARLATRSPDAQPDVVPIAFEFAGEFFWIGGSGASVLSTRQVRNVVAGGQAGCHGRRRHGVVRPLHRGIRIYGLADEPVEREGMVGPGLPPACHSDGLLELEYEG